MNNENLKETQCGDCVRKSQCDLYLEEDGNVNFGHPCMSKTWYNEDGKLENNTERHNLGLPLKP